MGGDVFCELHTACHAEHKGNTTLASQMVDGVTRESTCQATCIYSTAWKVKRLYLQLMFL